MSNYQPTIRGNVIDYVSVAIEDDTDVTLPLGNLTNERIVAVYPVEQVLSSDAYINYLVVNATGTSVVVTASTSVASASGKVQFAVVYKR
jgi:hypothetical protein